MDTTSIEGYMQRGLWDEAIEECRIHLKAFPGNVRLLGLLGVCHFRQEEWESAAAALRRATILDPTFFDAGVKLALALNHLERHLEAYEVAAEYHRLRPGDNTLAGLIFTLEKHFADRRIEGWESSIRTDQAKAS